MAKFATVKDATSISAAAAVALLLSGLGIALWHGMGAGWRHEEAAPQQVSLSLRLTSIIGASATSAHADDDKQAAAAAEGGIAATAAVEGGSAGAAAAEEPMGTAEAGAGLERFRFPSQQSYDKLQLRAAEVPGLNSSRAVSFLTSTLHDPLTTALTQNCIYSLVKFAEVTNYIVAVWSEEALGACADLNLPCADIRPLVEARGLPEEKRHGQFVTWTRHIVAERVLDKGLVMHFMGEGRAWSCALQGRAW
ncbi:hypothetical protein ABPG75_003301 [Micractinium tetrahymenae]